MLNLCHLNNKIGLIFVWSLMTLSVKSKLSARAHTWFNLDDFSTDSHLLSFSITLNNHSFKVDFLSASIVKFFKCAFNSNRQILKFSCESSHHFISSGFNSSNLITVFVKSNGIWICRSKEPFENL